MSRLLDVIEQSIPGIKLLLAYVALERLLILLFAYFLLLLLFLFPLILFTHFIALFILIIIRIFILYLLFLLFSLFPQRYFNLFFLCLFSLLLASNLFFSFGLWFFLLGTFSWLLLLFAFALGESRGISLCILIRLLLFAFLLRFYWLAILFLALACLDLLHLLYQQVLFIFIQLAELLLQSGATAMGSCFLALGGLLLLLHEELLLFLA